MREERSRLGGPATRGSRRRARASTSRAADIHRVLHAGGGPAVTLHAYSPPLWRMGAYLVEPDGGLQRHSVSYAEELRPLQAA